MFFFVSKKMRNCKLTQVSHILNFYHFIYFLMAFVFWDFLFAHCIGVDHIHVAAELAAPHWLDPGPISWPIVKLRSEPQCQFA